MPDNLTQRYLHRELSALEFNFRVLHEATDKSNPLLERLKFLGIVSSNLDEFFMVRMSGLDDVESDTAAVKKSARSLYDSMNRVFSDEIVPDLEAAGLVRVKPSALDARQLEYVRIFFERELFPVLTPVALREDQSPPVLNGLRLHLIVELSGPSKSEGPRHAVVEIPQNFPRILNLPGESAYAFTLVEDLISLFCGRLFTGFEVSQLGLFRITRGAELTLDEEKDEDFMKTMSEALRQRRSAEIVRLEAAVPGSLAEVLARTLKVSPPDLYRSDAWLDLKSLAALANQPGFETLKRPVWEPVPVDDFEDAGDPWEVLRKKNICVMHPYESFDAVSRFVASAADDPGVLAIKQTLYRAGSDSDLIRSLERAAEKGKQVTVLVELKARFDEESNIEWARRLQLAGASVLYGVAGLKTHAKASLVVRREPEGIKRYVHLSTGNYNEKTARLYSDIGFFTGDDAMASDISAFFNVITGYSQPAAWSKIEVAPFGLRNKLLRLVRREAMRSTRDKPGLIMAKLNSLADPELIDALYEASRKHVAVRLNVRGICCLRPGVKDLSENIDVVSIVDMFLEHSRILFFANGGEHEVYLSSADWMPRNLDRRLEILFPVEDPDNKKALTELLKVYFKDNVKSWRLLSDGSYHRNETDPKKKFRVQEYLCRKFSENRALLRRKVSTELRPQKPSNP